MSPSKYEIIDSYRIKNLNVQVLKFLIPLDHSSQQASPTINVVARLVTKHNQDRIPNNKPKSSLDLPEKGSNICVYLQGGPGFPCAAPDYSGVTKVMIDKGFQMLYLDQRGTGLSSQIDTGGLLQLPSDDSRLGYLRFFRALDIVKDAEFIRKILIGSEKWSILGQSYGGFCSTTYLSYYPDSLNQLLITGGIPPIGKGPDDVYAATYKRTEERNEAYYEKYPGDITKVHELCEYLSTHQVQLPNGGSLTVERLQAIGISFGATAGTDGLHQQIFNLHFDLTNYGRFTYGTLQSFENFSSFDTNIIYFLFQEAIYLDSGKKSNWSADRLRYQNKINYDFPSLKKKINKENLSRDSIENAVYFTGEMVFKSMLENHLELRQLKGLAEKLHQNTDWGQEPLYKKEVLLQNKVPVAAATYYYDQYVDFNISMESRKYIKGAKQYITNEFFHNGLRDDPAKILDILLKLLENGETL